MIPNDFLVLSTGLVLVQLLTQDMASVGKGW